MFVFEQVTIKVQTTICNTTTHYCTEGFTRNFYWRRIFFRGWDFLVRLIASKLLQFKNILHFDILWLFLFL